MTCCFFAAFLLLSSCAALGFAFRNCVETIASFGSRQHGVMSLCMSATEEPDGQAQIRRSTCVYPWWQGLLKVAALPGFEVVFIAKGG